ncbi:hypothetical protein C5C00_01680 [Rathayibacter rathayi]|uniref:hypothetical protein n=1 Tax=Rathayibacter rathayi TaxID=33887 RepID=UPI000CE89D7D|nr:hypothetical protein [Rathayibacter rathayi]PPG90712.1 hypothetical protein C5C47_00955 [Rathayibacter rathayi]PPG98758.1 hypothetical protein C5C00_01680 [Rathayibacter rathayi]
MAGRKQKPGTSASSQVRVQPIWNQPIDRRKFARAVIALVLWQMEQDPAKRRTAAAEESTDNHQTEGDSDA